jgi:transposase-like protein
MGRRGNVSYLVSEGEDRVPSLKRTAKFLCKEEVPVEQQIITKSVSKALSMVKEMNLSSEDEWSGDYRDAARSSIAVILRERMEEKVAGHLSWAYQKGIPDRRNGSYVRHVLTELGDIVLLVPRTRHYNPRGIIAAYARRTKEIDHLILTSFLLGLSTRKVGVALLTLLGEKVSPQTVSRVGRTLDEAVKAYHRRRITGRFRALILDGIVIKRKTGAGVVARPVLVALGLRHDGKKEIVDFRLARSESGPEWESFLTNLISRGLTGIEVICADGGQGLISVLPTVYPGIPLQRCFAHKIRNILDKVSKKSQKTVKRGLAKIYNAGTYAEARTYAKRWARSWIDKYPKAVKCLRDDLDDLLICFQFIDPEFRKAIRTTNAIERRFREVRRRTRPMGVFSDRTSIERILYGVFMYENINQGVCPVFVLTQND